MREKGCQDKVSQRSKKLCERKGKTLCESVCERERERGRGREHIKEYLHRKTARDR